MGKLKDYKLTDKQLIFCHDYITNGYNHVEAAKVAGYSLESADRIGNNMKRSKYVKAYLDKLMEEREKDKAITYAWKLAKLKVLADVTIPDDAQSIEEVHGSWGVSAIKEMNLMQGHYAEKAQTEVTVGIENLEIVVKELEDKHKKDY